MNWTGYQNSFAPANLVDQIGLLGHLPSCSSIGSWGILGSGASIVTEIPIGLSFQDLDDTIVLVVVVVSISIASAIGFLPLPRGPTSICSNSARIV